MLYLYDDAVARRWQPFALTRPIGELLLGAYTFRDRAERFFGERCTGHVSAPHLLGFDESDAAPVVDLASIDTSRPRIFLSSRAVLDSSAVVPAVRTPAVLRVGDDTVGCVLPAGTANPGLSELDP
ncbi:MAG: putative sugar nucleotidyl transferase, partial [Gemmatimonadota bacterium]